MGNRTFYCIMIKSDHVKPITVVGPQYCPVPKRLDRTMMKRHWLCFLYHTILFRMKRLHSDTHFPIRTILAHPKTSETHHKNLLSHNTTVSFQCSAAGFVDGRIFVIPLRTSPMANGNRHLFVLYEAMWLCSLDRGTESSVYCYAIQLCSSYKFLRDNTEHALLSVATLSSRCQLLRLQWRNQIELRHQIPTHYYSLLQSTLFLYYDYHLLSPTIIMSLSSDYKFAVRTDERRVRGSRRVMVRNPLGRTIIVISVVGFLTECIAPLFGL